MYLQTYYVKVVGDQDGLLDPIKIINALLKRVSLIVYEFDYIGSETHFVTGLEILNISLFRHLVQTQIS